ncbi:MAG: J domain-containing protein [Candidatus Omnitrophica bacterium]|nr:J domain-containing protein [Candidatus Omnitrophota bacterium]
MLDFSQIAEARIVLGLEEFAAMEQITDAYRKLAVKYHQDKCKNKDKKKCEEKFKKIAAR